MSAESTAKAKAAKAEEKEEKAMEQVEDLIQLFTTPVENLSDEELASALTRMGEMRKTRIATKKKSDYIVDILLPKLTTSMAEKILKKFAAKEREAKEAKEDAK